MSPEKLLNDPIAAPFIMGMVVKIKDWAALKGMAISVTFIITTTSAITVFYTQTSAMLVENKTFRKEVTQELIKIKIEMASVKQSIAITNNNVEHFVNNLTAKVDEIQANIAKIRR